jgi:hypothetical protein
MCRSLRVDRFHPIFGSGFSVQSISKARYRSSRRRTSLARATTTIALGLNCLCATGWLKIK